MLCLVNNATADLVAHYKFDEGSGTIAFDLSGNNHHATLKGGVNWAGEGSPVNGDALSFDGYSDGVNHTTDPGTIDWVSVDPFDVTGGDGITLAAWIRPEGFYIGDARIITKQKTWSSIDIWWMLSTYTDGTALRMRLKTDDGGADNGTTTMFSDTGYLEAGVWSHVAATYDGSKMRLYHNGVEIMSTDKTGTIQTDPTVAVAIGNGPLGDPGGLRAPFHGLIDDVRIYNEALTQAEIETLYRPSPPPIAHWPFDEGAGNTAADIVGGHDGTLKGGVAWAGEGSPVNGDSLSFDGSTPGAQETDPGNINWVDVGTMDVTGGTGLTLAAWIRPEGFGIGDARIINKAKNWWPDIVWMLSTYGDNPKGTALRFRVMTEGQASPATLYSDTGYLEAGVWSHTVATYDIATNKMKIYHNGEVIVEADHGVGGPVATDLTITASIGNSGPGLPGGLSHTFHGLIDDVRIYNQALTQAEIETIKNGG